PLVMAKRRKPPAKRPAEMSEEVRRPSLIPKELWDQGFSSPSLLASAVSEASGLLWKAQDKPRSIACQGGVPRPNFECGCCVLIKCKAKLWWLQGFRSARGVKANTHSDACQHKAQLPIRHVEYPVAETAVPDMQQYLATRNNNSSPFQVLASLTDNVYLLEGGFVVTLTGGSRLPTGTMGPECEVERIEMPTVEKPKGCNHWYSSALCRFLTVGPDVFRYDKGKLHVMDIATREWREEPHSQDTPDCDADRSSLFALDHDLYLLGYVDVPANEAAPQPMQQLYGMYFSQDVTEVAMWRFDTDGRGWHRLPPPPVKGCRVMSVVDSRVYVCHTVTGDVYSYTPGTAGVGEGTTKWEKAGDVKIPGVEPVPSNLNYGDRVDAYNPSMVAMGRHVVPLRPESYYDTPPFLGYDTITQGVTEDFSHVTLAPLDMRQAHDHCSAWTRPPIAYVLKGEFTFRVLQVDTAYEEDC
ncbi:hypothetical protein KIPB_006577, partial [Kipferlia bialata]